MKPHVTIISGILVLSAANSETVNTRWIHDILIHSLFQNILSASASNNVEFRKYNGCKNESLSILLISKCYSTKPLPFNTEIPALLPCHRTGSFSLIRWKCHSLSADAALRNARRVETAHCVSFRIHWINLS